MTVCLAALFNWNYADKRGDSALGRACIAISDRMITAGDVEYEPQQPKVAQLADNTILLIAGDYSIHSQAIKNAHAQLKGDKAPDPYRVAKIYGAAIQGIRRQQAEDLYLAPLGLNTDSFLAQQREMSDALTNALLDKVLNHRGSEAEAIVIGMSTPTGANQPGAQLYVIDDIGGVTCHDDVGFAAIGIGAAHAKSKLMQLGYTNGWSFSPALTAAYAAKKAAEVAPGVGKGTDITFVHKEFIAPLWERVYDKVTALHEEYEQAEKTLSLKSVMQLQDFISQPVMAPVGEENQEGQGIPGGGAQGGVSAGSAESGATRGEEHWPQRKA